MSAKIVWLSDYRSEEPEACQIDLSTAVDVAIRDLREVLTHWGSDAARSRIEECEAMLRSAFESQMA